MSEISKNIFGVAEQIKKVWEKIPKTKILNQENSIIVPENLIEYSMFIKIPSNFRSIRKKIKIDNPDVTKISVSALHPLPMTLRGIVTECVTEDGRTIHAITPSELPKDCDLISVTVCYKIKQTLLDDLVDRKTAHEPSGSEMNEYWMSAKLKHPKALTEHANFKRFDLNDVDVTVDVGVHNELKNSIPNSFIRRMKEFFTIMEETDPRRQWLAIPKLRQLAKSETAGREFNLVVDLESLFFPEEFAKYIDVTKDFKYSSCYKGKEAYELPMPIIPKKMNVISRTNLTLEKPAAEGILVYKNKKFIDAIKQILK
ncbi:MAG: hypothetical protein IAX21_03770 [Candidatus Bathyarchaeota archaeon]|nr:MAG: hypothetical protein IAX21_03770 [Candidatus Bathyarchaeota archaeon]